MLNVEDSASRRRVEQEVELMIVVLGKVVDNRLAVVPVQYSLATTHFTRSNEQLERIETGRRGGDGGCLAWDDAVACNKETVWGFWRL